MPSRVYISLLVWATHMRHVQYLPWCHTYHWFPKRLHVHGQRLETIMTVPGPFQWSTWLTNDSKYCWLLLVVLSFATMFLKRIGRCYMMMGNMFICCRCTFVCRWAFASLSMPSPAQQWNDEVGWDNGTRPFYSRGKLWLITRNKNGWEGGWLIMLDNHWTMVGHLITTRVVEVLDDRCLVRNQTIGQPTVSYDKWKVTMCGATYMVHVLEPPFGIQSFLFTDIVCHP